MLAFGAINTFHASRLFNEAVLPLTLSVMDYNFIGICV